MQAGAAQAYGHAHAQEEAEAWERQQRSRTSSQELQHAERANEAMRPDDPDAAATGPLTRATDIHGPAAILPLDSEGWAGTLALGGGAASAAAENPSPQDGAWSPRSAESSTLDSRPGAAPCPSATPNPSAQQPLAQQTPAQLTSTRQMSASSTQDLDDLQFPPQQPPVARRPYSAAPGKRLVSARPPARPSQLTNSTQTVGSLFPSHTGGPIPLALGVPAPPILLGGGVATPAAAARPPRAPPPRPPARQPSLRQPPSSVTLSLGSGVPHCSDFQSSSPRPVSAPSPASTPPRVGVRLSAAAAAAASGRPQTAAYGPPSHESAPHRRQMDVNAAAAAAQRTAVVQLNYHPAAFRGAPKWYAQYVQGLISKHSARGGLRVRMQQARSEAQQLPVVELTPPADLRPPSSPPLSQPEMHFSRPSSQRQRQREGAASGHRGRSESANALSLWQPRCGLAAAPAHLQQQAPRQEAAHQQAEQGGPAPRWSSSVPSR